LYPKTRLIVTRVKREGSLVDYTSDVAVEIDYSDVDPDVLKAGEAALEENSLENITTDNS